jgi:dienelactone hydrolase
MDLQPIAYEVNGKPYTGFLADGSQGRAAPGVLVAHEGGGMTDHPKDRARMLAELGYVAFAMDTFGEPVTDMARSRQILGALMADPDELRARAITALDVLKRQPNVDAGRLAAIGFCFGGTTVLELAKTGADVACVVGFHSGLLPARVAEPGAIKAKVLVCMGSADPIIPAEQRDGFAAEMTAAGADWQMLVLGGVGHSFTNPGIDALGFPGFNYDAVADRRAWAAMRDLFDETLGPVTA